MKRFLSIQFTLIGVVGLADSAAFGQTLLRTAFTYQGQLKETGEPAATGLYDFEFTLWTEAGSGCPPVGGAQIGSAVVFSGSTSVQVTDGLFTVQLNESGEFGEQAFNSEERWLEISVAPTGSPLTILCPRQPVTGTPYALQTRGIFVDDGGNVGIGTTIPDARVHVASAGDNLDDYTAEFNSSLSVAGAGGVLFSQGNAFAHKLHAQGTGGSDGKLEFSYIDRSDGSVQFDNLLALRGSGRVGIGTGSPTSLLDVFDGGIRARRNATQWIEILDNSSLGGFITNHSAENNKKTLHIQSVHDGSGSAAGETLIIFEVGDEAAPMSAMCIKESGSVGIGTTSPQSELHVVGTDTIVENYSARPGFIGRRANGTSAAPTAVAADDTLMLLGARGHDGSAFSQTEAWFEMKAAEPWTATEHGAYMTFHTTTAGTLSSPERMRITDSGRVGIGTASPSALLDIEGAGATTDIHINNTAAEGDPTIRFQLGGTTVFSLGVDDSDANKFKIGTGAPQTNTRMTIDSTGNVGIGTTDPAAKLEVIASSGDGVYGATSGSGYGVHGYSGLGWGVYGETDSGRGVFGYATATSGVNYGVRGVTSSTSGYGVEGRATASSGLNYGVRGVTSSTSGSGVEGSATASSGYNYGVFGWTNSINGKGIQGWAPATSGVNWGVIGQTDSTSGRGVQGRATASSGVNYGVYGSTDSQSGFAGYFVGNVDIVGWIDKDGGSFKIDHPLDPENKYLYHSFVESPDMMNIYNGNVLTDQGGYATIELPEWFEALNHDFRYQLTVVDEEDSDSFVLVKIVRKIENNQFIVRTSEPNVEVSWQVTGIRQDAYANANRIPVEVEKPEDERGRYRHPELYGKPRELRIGYVEMEGPSRPSIEEEAYEEPSVRMLEEVELTDLDAIKPDQLGDGEEE